MGIVTGILEEVVLYWWHVGGVGSLNGWEPAMSLNIRSTVLDSGGEQLGNKGGVFEWYKLSEIY